MVHKTELGHQIYKTTWFSVINEKLDCKKKEQEKALRYSKQVVEVSLKNGILVSHIPSELSTVFSLLNALGVYIFYLILGWASIGEGH